MSSRICQAANCQSTAHGQTGIWCQHHLAQIPPELKERIFWAWAANNPDRQAQLVADAIQYLEENA